MSVNHVRYSASSSFNPLCKIQSFSVRNGDLGAISHFCSTAIATAAEPSSPRPPSSPDLVRNHTLFRRVMGATDPTNPTSIPISQVLNQWVGEGRKVDIHDARSSIKHLRRYKRHHHALQISEWIGSTDSSNFTTGDAAVHLDLIFKVHGLEQAEKYIESLPDDRKAKKWKAKALIWTNSHIASC